MIVYDNKDNVALEAPRIRTSYLVNVSASKKPLALASLHLVPHTIMYIIESMALASGTFKYARCEKVGTDEYKNRA